MANLAEIIQQYLNQSQPISEIVAAILTFTLAIVVAWLGHSVFKKYLLKWASKTKTRLDDGILRNIRAPVFLLAILIGAYYGLQCLTILETYQTLMTLAFAIAEILVVTFIITRVINVLISWYTEETEKRGKKVSNHILFVFKRATQIIIYTLAFLVVLWIFRIDLSGVVVGLGVGGIAIALALQTILGDAFSALSIYFDRPFELGDFIVVGDYSGTVLKIGMKSTRIQLLQGEELIMSNKELATSCVRNFKKLKRRRISFTIRVTYDTSLEKLKKIPKILSEIIDRIELAEVNSVNFRKFGDFSLDFEVIYYLDTADYSKYLEKQQDINYAIIEAFEREGIKMAYPTQTILLNK